MSPEKLLAGKRAVVTGSSSGLGRAYALALASEGASVVINGRRAEKVNQVVEEIRSQGGTALPCAESVATWQGAEQVIQTAIDGFGGIDILVNNAGDNKGRMIFNLTEEDFHHVADAHLIGTVACTHFASRWMKDQNWGRIINTVSYGMWGVQGLTAYSAAKGGVCSATYTWYLELRKYNITVNGISPVAQTAMTNQGTEERRRSGHLRAGGSSGNGPETVAPLVVYLCTEDAGFINGQVIIINGARIAIQSHPNELAVAYQPEGWTVEKLLTHYKSTLGRWHQTIEDLGNIPLPG